jgi:hypothetical protein
MARIAAEVEKQYKEMKEAKRKTLSHKGKDAKLSYVPAEWKLQNNKDGRWVFDVKETDHAAVHNLAGGVTFASLFSTFFCPGLLKMVMDRLRSLNDDEIQTRIPSLSHDRMTYALPDQPPIETDLNLALLYRYYAVRLYLQFTASKPPRAEKKTRTALK